MDGWPIGQASNPGPSCHFDSSDGEDCAAADSLASAGAWGEEEDDGDHHARLGGAGDQAAGGGACRAPCLSHPADAGLSPAQLGSWRSAENAARCPLRDAAASVTTGRSLAPPCPGGRQHVASAVFAGSLPGFASSVPRVAVPQGTSSTCCPGRLLCEGCRCCWSLSSRTAAPSLLPVCHPASPHGGGAARSAGSAGDGPAGSAVLARFPSPLLPMLACRLPRRSATARGSGTAGGRSTLATQMPGTLHLSPSCRVAPLTLCSCRSTGRFSPKRLARRRSADVAAR